MRAASFRWIGGRAERNAAGRSRASSGESGVGDALDGCASRVTTGSRVGRPVRSSRLGRRLREPKISERKQRFGLHWASGAWRDEGWSRPENSRRQDRLNRWLRAGDFGELWRPAFGCGSWLRSCPSPPDRNQRDGPGAAPKQAPPHGLGAINAPDLERRPAVRPI
jgi:hypothetical protein